MKLKIHDFLSSKKKSRSKIKLIYIFLLCVSCSVLSAQQTNLTWAKQFGGDGVGNSIGLDTSGNMYITGGFDGTVDFDPGISTANLIAAGQTDIFVCKLDASGNFVWARQIGGVNNDIVTSIATDGSGNTYIAGHFEGTVDFNPGISTANLTAAGQTDIFVCKLDASGNFIWAKGLGGTAYDHANSIVLDGSGNVHTTGYFSGTVDFDPGIGTANLSSTLFYNEIFVSKLDASGNFVWAKQLGGSAFDNGYGITIDGSGNVYTTGIFQGTADFDPGSGTSNLTAIGGPDIFVSKLDASGSFIWAKQMGGSAFDSGNFLTTDNSGNVYTTGFFDGTVDFDPGAGTFNLTSVGNQDVFISKLNSLGNFVWAKQFGDTSDDEGNSIVVDDSGYVYTAGFFQGTADFDPGLGTFNLTSAGGEDIFISKLDTSGSFTWVKQFGGTNSDFVGTIALDADRTIYIPGGFSGTVDFDPESGTYDLTASGSGDGFVIKLGQIIPKLSSGSCGITETTLSQALYVDYVAGATDYRYEVTDPGNNVVVVNRGASSTDFYMTSVTGIGYGVTYSIRVAAYIGGTWTPYGSACNVTTPTPPTTQLSTGYCGITETSLADILFCDNVPGATDYRYELTDPGSNVTVYYHGSASTYFYLYPFTGIGYGITYSIRVAAAVGGTWTAYGSACNVTTPAPPTTQLSTGYCGITETSLTDILFCDNVPGATDYRYELTDPGSNVTVYYHGSASTYFYLYQFTGIGYGTTYSIRVAAAIGGTWTAYGSACNVTTPAPPTTQLSTGYCGITETSLTDILFCDNVPGATDYRYEFTDPGSNVTVYYHGNASTYFYLYSFPGISYGITYSIRVAAAVGGTWTAYGSACSIISAGPKPAHDADTTGLITGIKNINNEVVLINAYPNPTDKELTIDLGQSYEEAALIVINSLGQEIFNKKFDLVKTIPFNLEGPKGIYFVNLHSKGNTFTRLKVIKQ